jgi:hypothetical protein
MRTIVLHLGVALAAASLVTVTSAATAPAASQSVAAPPAVSPASPMPPPNRTIYAPTLPSVDELSDVAKAQGLTIEKIEQTADQVAVEYRHPDGRLSTVAYRRLSSADTAPPVAGVVPAAPAVAPHTTIIYQSPPDYWGPDWGPGSGDFFWDPDFGDPDWGRWHGDWDDGDDR